ncbi:MAG: hypothetical protein RH949_20550 [Coleofasciculus sp. A1-SPW-01]|uniref:hypothetical protein n=1 Tax=Coleofasciculus sp. A1-SPW-01 TaxID=3070819 RepID=UPI0032F82663
MMNRNLTPPNLEEAEQLFNDLLEEVSSKEANLAGGEAQDGARGKTAIQRLKETSVTFGDPRSRLIPLTAQGFAAQGIELDYEVRQLMHQFDFYSMVVSVDPRPQPSVEISGLECHLSFGSQGNQAPIVHRIIPGAKWQPIINIGVEMNLGLDANLDVSAGVDAAELAKVERLPDYNRLKANVGSKDNLKLFTVLDGLNYQLGKFDIIAQGDDNSECYWRIEKPKLQDQATVKFGIIFKVPKGWDSIELTGQVWIEPEMDWLFGELSHVIKALPGHLKDIFGSKARAAKQFAVGQKEAWIGENKIILPHG